MTTIEWTDKTWNPIRGCARVSEGCRNCYAERIAARFSGRGLAYEGLAKMTTRGPRWTGQVRVVETKLSEPLSWTKPHRVFVNSMSDLFHQAVSIETLAAIFDTMSTWAVCRCRKRYCDCELDSSCWRELPQHKYQILTKRPERMREALSDELPRHAADYWDGDSALGSAFETGGWPLPNVWLGVSIEDQTTAEERIPPLLETPAAVRWVSAEPLLGEVDLTPWMDQLDWVVVGGESGPGSRPMNQAWALSLLAQCSGYDNTPFFFKQWGDWALARPGEHPGKAEVLFPRPMSGGAARVVRVGKKAAGRTLLGREWNEIPEVAT